jgi:hypothetical protein
MRFLYRREHPPLEFIWLPLLHSRHVAQGALKMLDAIMLAIAFVFFAVSIAYVYACDQL